MVQPPDDGVAPDPADSTNQSDPSGTAVPPSDQARRAVERAREAARSRGSTLRPARAAARESAQRRREASVDRAPYGEGRDPSPLGEEMSRIFARMGWTESLEVASVTARWRELVGDAVADHCEPLGFEAGVLTVQASSTAWATQIRLMSGTVTQRLNEAVGRAVVTEMRVLGPSARSWAKGPRRVPGRGPRDTYG